MQKKNTQDFNELICLVQDFAEIVDKNLMNKDSFYYASWKYLSIYVNILNMLLLTWESKVLHNENVQKHVGEFLILIFGSTRTILAMYLTSSIFELIEPYFNNPLSILNWAMVHPDSNSRLELWPNFM